MNDQNLQRASNLGGHRCHFVNDLDFNDVGSVLSSVELDLGSGVGHDEGCGGHDGGTVDDVKPFDEEKWWEKHGNVGGERWNWYGAADDIE